MNAFLSLIRVLGQLFMRKPPVYCKDCEFWKPYAEWYGGKKFQCTYQETRSYVNKVVGTTHSYTITAHEIANKGVLGSYVNEDSTHTVLNKYNHCKYYQVRTPVKEDEPVRK
jgi:hypothetical protein